jgi:hypothetical protein
MRSRVVGGFDAVSGEEKEDGVRARAGRTGMAGMPPLAQRDGDKERSLSVGKSCQE